MRQNLRKLIDSRQSYCNNNQAYFFGPPSISDLIITNENDDGNGNNTAEALIPYIDTYMVFAVNFMIKLVNLVRHISLLVWFLVIRIEF